MKTTRATTVATAALCAAGVAFAAPIQPGMTIPGEYIVTTIDGPRALTTLSNEIAAAGFVVAKQDRHASVMLVHTDPNDGDAARRLSQLPGVVLVEPNGMGSGGLVPDDTFFGAQWHLVNTGQSGGTAGADVNADAAWSVATGSSSITIAVLDSGSDFGHPDMAGRFLPGGFDFVAEDNDPTGDHPHGTQVAGVIAANPNNGFAVSGIDHGAGILTIKVLNSSNAGTTFDQVQGLNYVAADSDVDIISLSLINYPNNASLRNAIANARAAGKIVIACAGNGGFGNADVSWPGASDQTISIGATERDDRRAWFSATGAALDFVAPGRSITTVDWLSRLDETATASGCSFATPLSAGVAGLLLARAEELGFTLTHDDVYRLFQAGAVDQVGLASEDTPGWDPFHGWGRLDAAASLGFVADCNNNGVLDLTDIDLGTSPDADGDGVPDGCTACVGDSNGDGVVNTTDLLAVLANFGEPTNEGPVAGDLDASGDVNTADLLALLSGFAAPCP